MMQRKRFEWKLKSRNLQLGDRTLIMAILNVTPDSFSDGGNYSDTDRAYARALQLEEEGADIIDIGAESTRPGSARITEDEEIRRLIPLLKRLEGKLTVPVSVDTYKAGIAERAIDLGVEIINDPSGLTFEPDLAKRVMNADAGLVLNHMRGTPESWAKLPPQPDVAGSTIKDLEAMVNRAVRAGMDKHRIVLDPGLGFGKRKEQNFELIARLSQFAGLDLPLLIGPSRKQFLAQATDAETAYANAAAVAAAVMNGAHIVRVHEVREMAIAARVADAIAVAAPLPVEVEPERPYRAERPQLRAPRAMRPPLMSKTERPAAVEPVQPPLAPPAEDSTDEAVEPVEASTPVEQEPVEAPKEKSKPARASRPLFENRPPRAEPPRQREDRPAPRGDRPSYGGDRPPRRTDGPPRSDRPSARSGDDRPARRTDGPPRGDRPSYGDSKPPRRSDGPPRGDRPSYGDSKPPRLSDGPPRGDRPSYGDSKPPRRSDGPPRGDRPPRPEGRPPSREGKPPQRKEWTPRGDRPDRGGDRPSSPPASKGARPRGGMSRPPAGGPPRGDDRPSRPPRPSSGGSRPDDRKGGGKPRGPKPPPRKRY